MRLQARASPGRNVQAGIKLARLMEMPEKEVAGRVTELEAEVMFRRLLRAQVIAVQPYANAAFIAQRLGGWGLRTASEGLPASLDGDGDLARLLRKVGRRRFEECFLGEGGLPDVEISRRCRITRQDAARIRELVNSLYIKAEFEDSAHTPAPPKVYSAVAGVTLNAGRPGLAFFNRPIWKGRYQVDEGKLSEHLSRLSPPEARKVEALLRELRLLDRRKSTLYGVLESLLDRQAAFFASGDPDARQAVTQREVAGQLDVSPSALNRLISNKSVELPWGLQAPLKTLMPSRKSLIRDRLDALLREFPAATDAELSGMIRRLFGAALSCRSVTQYRAELGLPNVRSRRKKSA